MNDLPASFEVVRTDGELELQRVDARLRELQALVDQRIDGAALDVYGQQLLSRHGHSLSALYDRDNLVLWPH